jgi:hypothetical protein
MDAVPIFLEKINQPVPVVRGFDHDPGYLTLLGGENTQNEIRIIGQFLFQNSFPVFVDHRQVIRL